MSDEGIDSDCAQVARRKTPRKRRRRIADTDDEECSALADSEHGSSSRMVCSVYPSSSPSSDYGRTSASKSSSKPVDSTNLDDKLDVKHDSEAPPSSKPKIPVGGPFGIFRREKLKGFLQEMRASPKKFGLKDEGSCTVGPATKLLSQRFDALPEDEKAPYNLKWSKEMEAYEQALSKWRRGDAGQLVLQTSESPGSPKKKKLQRKTAPSQTPDVQGAVPLTDDPTRVSAGRRSDRTWL